MANTYVGYSVDYYESPTVGHGMAGIITDDGSTVTPYPDVNTSLNGDPLVQGFIPPFTSDLRLAVTDRIASSSDNVSIYDPTNVPPPISPIATVPGGWPNVSNLYALVPFGSYLYALDYDNARVVEIDPSTYAETGVTYALPSSFNPDPSTYTAYGQALFEANGNLYGLFIFMNPSTFAFSSTSLLVKFTVPGGSPITVGSTDSNPNLASNSFAAAWDGSRYLYVAAIGGSQGASYNAASAIQKIDLTTGNLSTALVNTVMSASPSFPYNFLDISIDTSSSTFYILAGVYNSSFTGLNGVLQSTPNFSTFNTIDTISSAPGFSWTAQFTPDNSRIWYGRGNPIWVYDATSSPVSTVAQLTFTSGGGSTGLLISTGELYNSLNGFTYVGASGFFAARGYRSPIQVSKAPRAQRARAIAQGRPSLTDEELALLDREFNTK